MVNQLKPKRVIPLQYVNGDDPEGCDQEGASPDLDAMGGTAVRPSSRWWFASIPEKKQGHSAIAGHGPEVNG